MVDGKRLIEGQILTGPLFNEPMRVEAVQANGPMSWRVGLVGTQSERFRKVTLTADDLSRLTILDAGYSYDGDGRLLRLGLQAYALGIAYEFDPYFGLSISRVDPLPHQLEAVYDYLLKLARVRFLLADDAGAGKTIMSGLLIRELELRGLAERILIVCPANLAFQWQRELKEKFDEKFLVLKGQDIRDQFGVNQWMEQRRVITSLDLAKRQEILPGLRQVHWDLIIVDEAHRMSAADESHKSLRYKLGELLRDISDHMLLLTATPHKGDPQNFSLFLQLLDADAYADVKSIRQAMDHRRAPFYLRRTKEAMVYFPERRADGTWAAQPIFTRRIPHTVDFQIDGAEFDLYRDVTRFVKRESARAAAAGEDPRARAIGFLMSLYQRRLASSTHAMRRSLENRARRLDEGLKRAQDLARLAPPDLPDPEELEEMEENERERLEAMLEAVTLAGSGDLVRQEIQELRRLAAQAQAVEDAGVEAKLSEFKDLLQKEGFFDRPDQRLLLFTEFKDTLDYLVSRLKSWGFRVGYIHGGMQSGARDEPGTRLHAEQQFREGEIQVLVATEAAGEGINLQVCNILFNYDIPWNPNRLEQRMGRIHRYGQRKDCRREARPAWWWKYTRCQMSLDELVEDSESIGCLTPQGTPRRVKSSLEHRFSFPPQQHKLAPGDGPVDPATGKGAGTIVEMDEAAGTVTLRRGPSHTSIPLPTALIPPGPIPTNAQRDALARLAGSMLAGNGRYRALEDILARARPRLAGGFSGPIQTMDLREQRERAAALDQSYLFIQGPPGTGKTWTGARIIVDLIRRGRRVGVAATSHKAIHNLLDEVGRAAREEGVPVRGLKKCSKGDPETEYGSDWIANVDDNDELIDRARRVQLLAGTAWLFAREEFDGGALVDTLVIDEAGQVSLADALAMGTAARNLILLGDPSQLAQVSQGTHPEGVGASVLEHLLGDHLTVPEDCGIFLDRTRRMHPGVCRFVSEIVYDNRLVGLPELANQTTAFGTGLRFLAVEHAGNVASSHEEAERVAQEIRAMVGGSCTNHKGDTRPLKETDFMVVAPYNMQVRLLRRTLQAAGLGDVPVGTVDKFQGREAPVVFYSMATSSAEDVPRTLDFLFSRNRLNVAVSRAMCLACIVASPRLLESRARTIEQMRLINALCRFAEMAER